VVRGIVIRTAASSGEVVLGLSCVRGLRGDERRAAVRALIDRVPHLVGLMEIRAPRRGHLLAGHHAALLWGRPYVAEDVAGVRFRIPLLAEFPVNVRALPGLIEMILDALDASPQDTVVETDAGVGGYTLHIALAARRVAAVTTEDQLDAAWENARANRLTNCHFYTRHPGRALEKIVRQEPVRRAFLHPPGTGLAAGLPAALRQAGVRHIVYLGRALRALADDAGALAGAGFRIGRVQPVDLSPHTSRIHALITATR